MSPNTFRDILELPSGYASAEVSAFMASLDDQTALLRNDLKDITPQEIEWQPAPGFNTIGMLLAHLAIVEVHWTQVGLRREPQSDTMPVLGIDVMDGDGMPIPAGGAPPAHLAGKPLAYFDDLLDRARAFAKETAVTFTAQDLERQHTRVRRDGDQQELNGRWVLYHMLEHFSGHYGQILLLRHQYRDALSAAQAPAR